MTGRRTAPSEVPPICIRRVNLPRGFRQAGGTSGAGFLEGLVGSVVHPVFEERDDKTGLLKGTAGRFVTVMAEGPRDLLGKLVEVRGEAVLESGRLRATILSV